jgi:hypothetical protein
MHPRLTWKQVRRYYGADRIREDDLVLYDPAKMRVERYRFRDSQISISLQTSTRWARTVHATGGSDTTMPLRRPGQRTSHLPPTDHMDSRMPGQRARPVRRAETGKPHRQRCTASSLRPDTSSWIREAPNCCSRFSPPEKNAPSLPAPPTPPSPNGVSPSPTPLLAAAVVDLLTFNANLIRTGTSSHRLKT